MAQLNQAKANESGSGLSLSHRKRLIPRRPTNDHPNQAEANPIARAYALAISSDRFARAATLQYHCSDEHYSCVHHAKELATALFAHNSFQTECREKSPPDSFLEE